MTPIRPAGQPFIPPTGAAPDAARSAAQRAFFDAAMGRSGATQAATPAAPAARPTFAVAPQRVELRPATGAEPPAKLLRPGSLLDIRI